MIRSQTGPEGFVMMSRLPSVLLIFFVGKKAQLFFSVTKCIQFGWCSMVEKHAPNSFAELYKKSICRLLLIELGPRVIKKPYAFLDMG